ncbi:MAG: T9SS type A sorting domain-containing protein [candidate division Zixibacteria bacterium]|nr:T9SS type A sorting domain-containing protein [candidate division Zixibacteria bacterium]
MPTITNIAFAGEVLNYRVENSWAYVRCFVYDEGSGDLIGRPVWDRLRTADHNYTAVVDTSVMSGPAIARFYAWRPDGGASDVTEFRFRVLKRGDINLNGIAGDVGDAVLFGRHLIMGGKVWDPVDSSVQIAATDVNADSITRTLADHVYLVRVVTGDASIAPKPSPLELPTGALRSHFRGDTLLVGWASNTSVGGLLLHLDRPDGCCGTPVLVDRAVGMTVTSHDDGRRLRILISGMARGAQIPAGDGAILAIPMGSSRGGISLPMVEAADYWGNPIAVDTAVRAPVREGAKLSQNTPNPFNSSTTICFTLPTEGHVILTIYNVLGQQVATPVDGILSGGNHQVTWAGADSHGRPLASGVYFYTLHTADNDLRRKMVVLK